MTWNRLQAVLRVVLVPITILFLCGVACAAEGGHGGSDSSMVVDLLYRAINFALLIIILAVVIRKTSMLKFFGDRRDDIQKTLKDLEAEKGKAEARARDLEQKLKEFEVQRSEIIEQYKAEGQAEKERIIAQAKERANQIVDQAEVTIQREVQAARDQLRRDVVDLSAQQAQDLISQHMSDQDQDHLVAEFIDKVEKLH